MQKMLEYIMMQPPQMSNRGSVDFEKKYSLKLKATIR